MNDLIASNKRRTFFLLTGFVVITVLVGMAVGVLIGNGATGTIIALVFSAVFAFGSYWKSDSVALAVSRAWLKVCASRADYQSRAYL
jgi:heat shock protein HtpX